MFNIQKLSILKILLTICIFQNLPVLGADISNVKNEESSLTKFAAI